MKKFLTLLFSICILFGCDKEDPIVTQINFESEIMTLQIGSNTTLRVHHSPSELVAPIYSWTSSDDSIVSVTQSGEILAHKLGDATITVTTEIGLKATCTITVSPIVATSIKLSENNLTLDVGDTHELTYDILPDNTTDKTVVWSSSDETVATVKDGVITAVNEGHTQIKIELDGLYNTCELSVNNVDVDGVSLSTSSLTIEKTETAKLIATITPSNATNCEVEWISSDISVVDVDDNGNIVGVEVGAATITATTANGEYSASCEITIKEISVKGVEIPYSSISMAISETRSFTANITPFNAANKSVKWSVSDSSIATIDNAGNVTILQNGYVSITATTEDGGYSASCFIEAKPIEQLLSINASGYSFSMGNSMNFSLNSKIQNPTNLNVSVESVCVVDKNGSVLVDNNTGYYHIQIIDKDIINGNYCYNYFDGFVIYGSSFGTTTFNEISTYKVIYYVVVNGVDYNVSANIDGNYWGNLNY